MGNSIAYTSGTTKPIGTYKQGNLLIGLKSQQYTDYSGFTWYANAETPNDNYLIISDTYSQGWSTQSESKPTFWRSETGTTESFVALVNQLPDVNGVTGFTNSYDAMNYVMNSGKYFVSKNNYKGLVSDGLRVCLDTSWYSSFSGSGTQWLDVKGTTPNNFNLVNGPAYNSMNGGVLYVDGTDDYIVSTNNSGILGNSPRSMMGWYYFLSSPSTWGNIITTGNGDCNGKMFGLSQRSGKLMTWGGCYDLSSNITLPTNTWLFLGVSYNGTNSFVFVNESNVTLSRPGYGTTESKIWLCAETTNNGGSFRSRMRGYIGGFYQYDRALSEEEIYQNYNATKDRFGL